MVEPRQPVAAAPDWAAVRAEFPLLAEWTYFNAATLGPVPQRALAAITAHQTAFNASGGLDFLDWYTQADRTRERIAALVGAEAADVAFLPNAATGLSWLLNALDWRSGDNIVTLGDEFPNNVYFPLSLQSSGVEVREYPVNEGFDLGRFLALVTPDTRVVLFSAMSYATGLRPPLEAIGERLRHTNAILAVDATQGAGAFPIDARAAHIGLLFVHCYKWMLCPGGIGFAAITTELRERLAPRVISWRSHKDWRNVTHLHHGVPEFPQSAAKYEGGMLNFLGIAALDAVVSWIHELGPTRVYDRVASIAESTRQQLREAGASLRSDELPHHDAPIISARFPGQDVDALATSLRAQKIALTARKGGLRVAPHFFNDATDIARLGEAIRGQFGR